MKSHLIVDHFRVLFVYPSKRKLLFGACSQAAAEWWQGGKEVGRLMDCVSIQQREFPACRAGVLGSADHLGGPQRLASLAPWVRTSRRRKQGGHGTLCAGYYPLYRLSWRIFCSYCEKTRALRYGFTTDSSWALHSFLCTGCAIHGHLKMFECGGWLSSSHPEATQDRFYLAVDVVWFSEGIKWRSNHHEDDPTKPQIKAEGWMR